MMPSHFDLNEVGACDTHEPCLAYDLLSPVPFVVNPMYSPQEEEDDCDEFPDIPQGLDQQQPLPATQQRSFSDVLNGSQFDFSLFPQDQSFAPYVEPRRVSLPARQGVSKPVVNNSTDYSVFVQQLMAPTVNYPVKEEVTFGNYSFDFQNPMPSLLTQSVMPLPEMPLQAPLPDVNLSITPPQPSNTPLPTTVTIKEEKEEEEPVEVDFNGRKHRKWRNRKYKCKHCDEIFYDKNLEEFAAHIQKVEKETGTTEVAGRHYKCEAPDCLWHIIGFVRKLEAQKHFDRRHGHPKFQCRFWCEGDVEKFAGSKTCSTRWHVDSGNRARHERAVHGQVFEQSKFS